MKRKTMANALYEMKERPAGSQVISIFYAENDEY